MRTSLNELKQIEAFLLSKKKSPAFEMEMESNPDLREKVLSQKIAYHLIKLFGRKLLKKDLNDLHYHLMHSHEHKRFQREVQKIYPHHKI